MKIIHYFSKLSTSLLRQGPLRGGPRGLLPPAGGAGEAGGGGRDRPGARRGRGGGRDGGGGQGREEARQGGQHAFFFATMLQGS